MSTASTLLRRFNRDTGVTFSDLAKRVGTSKCTISQIATGKRSVSVDLLAKLSKETGIPAAEWRPDLAKVLALTER